VTPHRRDTNRAALTQYLGCLDTLNAIPSREMTFTSRAKWTWRWHDYMLATGNENPDLRTEKVSKDRWRSDLMCAVLLRCHPMTLGIARTDSFVVRSPQECNLVGVPWFRFMFLFDGVVPMSSLEDLCGYWLTSSTRCERYCGTDGTSIVLCYIKSSSKWQCR
jgi:hypothetical protein